MEHPDYDELRKHFQIALGCLADLATNRDMDRETMQRKAKRIYEELSAFDSLARNENRSHIPKT